MKKECPTCSKSFHVKPSHFNIRVYCSKQCMAENYKVRYSGSKNLNYKGRDKEYLKCTICGKSFQPADLSRKSAKVCSNKCRNESISKALKGKPKSVEHVSKALETKSLRLDINNGQTLCTSCHEKEHPGKKFKRLKKPLSEMNI